MEVISETPLYAWILLAYLLYGGWKSRKTYVIAWKPLCILPAVMFLWSFYVGGIASHYGSLAIYLWPLSMAAGIWLGSLTARNLTLRFDKQQQLIEVSGSWTPMILSISIFALRYFLGAAYGMNPDLRGSAALFGVENLATVVSGMFTGRLVGYLQRSRTSPQVDLKAG